MAKRIDPLKYLTRTDKWYLGGGNRLTWTPLFPVWLDYPGFWDKAHYYNLEIGPVFTWTILDEDGHEIPLQAVDREWNPSKLTTRFEVKGSGLGGIEQLNSQTSNRLPNLAVTEMKCCLPNDVLTSVVGIRNLSRKWQKLHLIAWTDQPSYPSKQTGWLTDVEYENNKILFTKHFESQARPHFSIECGLGMNRKGASYRVNLSEGSAMQPHWMLTPFFEKFVDGELLNETQRIGLRGDGYIHMALHTAVEIGPKAQQDISVFFGAAPTKLDTISSIYVAARQSDPGKLSEQNWNDYFSGVPHFECSDEYFTRYYWYRWYGLKLLTMSPGDGNYKRPFVCEGIGDFRAPISYSTVCHMLENRWLHDPTLARGSLMTFIDNQRDDGGFRGYIDVDHFRQEMFYHANWGNSIVQLHDNHPSAEFLNEVYDGLKKYVCYFDRERDEGESGLYDIDNHYETGQEYMHRYLAVNPDADKDNWGKVFRLKGVDVTVYIYELKRALSCMARTLRKVGEAAGWDIEANRIKAAILRNMWDPDEEMFFDVDPATGRTTKVKAATCFYPYATDIVSEVHLAGFKRHLFNPKEFWTKFPVPSSSADDAYFSAEPEWKGKRMNCPWNGRVWPMADSQIAEAIARSAVRFHDKELRTKGVEFITKFIRMMFFDGDPKRPNCFEHYNPLTGAPSLYRGVDDYQHSSVNDLIIKYVAGVRTAAGKIILDPFEFDLSSFVLEDLIVQGHQVRVERRRSEVNVWLDGILAGKSLIGTPIVIDLNSTDSVPPRN